MVHERIPATEVDVSVLGTQLAFPCGRKAKNRFLKASISEKMSTWDPDDVSNRGIPTRDLINVYEKWGCGGFGVILTGNLIVDTRHLESAGNLIMCKENDSPLLRRAFSAIARVSKKDGALVIVQLSHAGRQTPISVNDNPYSCSDVPLESCMIKAGNPVALGLDQIRAEVIDRFVYAAKMARDTGFDGVEIHAAHGYLLSQFLSTITNKRMDEYGGPLQNRFRIIREIFEAIREEIPAKTGFVVGIKANSVEFQKDGLSTDDAKAACGMIEDCGFDFVELSGGNLAKPAWCHERESTKKREAYFIELAEKIRPVLKNCILYVTGGFRTAAAMVDAIQRGATDGIGFARPATAEPDLPLKILSRMCFSAPDTKIDQDDFVTTYFACIVQLGQMSKRPLAKLSSVCDDIADFSDPEEVKNFLKFIAVITREIEKMNSECKPIFGRISYRSLYQKDECT